MHNNILVPKTQIDQISFFFIFPGLTEPVLIRLDVDSKLSDQIKVKKNAYNL